MSRFTRTGWKHIEGLLPMPVRLVSPHGRQYEKVVEDGLLRVFVGPEPGEGWHLSISHSAVDANGHRTPGRYPSWDEIREARYEFIPNAVTMAMLLPPKEEYVNFHDTTFHLWETPT